MAEGGEGQKTVILDMDSELTAPVSKHRRPSIEQLIREQEQALLAERAREDAMQGPSQEELNKQAENREKLRSEIEDKIIPFEAFFARRASELHGAGESKLIGGNPPKYEVKDYTLDKEGEREYPFTLRYHINQHEDGGKEYVPDSYTQSLVHISKIGSGLLEKDKPPEINVQFENGAINGLAILLPNTLTKDELKHVLRERNVSELMMLPLEEGLSYEAEPQDLLVDISPDHPAIVLSGVNRVSHGKHAIEGHYNYKNRSKKEKLNQIYEMTSSGTFGPKPTRYKFSAGIKYDENGKSRLFQGKKRPMFPRSIASMHDKDDFTAQRFLNLTQELLNLIGAKNLNEEKLPEIAPEKDKKTFWSRIRGMAPEIKQPRS